MGRIRCADLPLIWAPRNYRSAAPGFASLVPAAATAGTRAVTSKIAAPSAVPRSYLAEQQRNSSCTTLERKQLISFCPQNPEDAHDFSRRRRCVRFFAWRNYLLVRKGVNENDDRRTALDRYVNGLYDAGERRVDTLQVAAVIYLKKLDELGEDRQARLAADETLAGNFNSRATHA